MWLVSPGSDIAVRGASLPGCSLLQQSSYRNLRNNQVFYTIATSTSCGFTRLLTLYLVLLNLTMPNRGKLCILVTFQIIYFSVFQSV